MVRIGTVRQVLRKVVPCAAICLNAGLLSIVSSPSHAANITHREISKGFEAIFIDGEIAPADVEQFRELSIRFKEAVVILDSLGGSLAPALEIGKLIRLTGYSTLVLERRTCTSSCALIWLAGSQRLLSPDGRVGFHASYLDNKGTKQETGVGNAIVGHYLSLLNLPQKAVVFATLAGPDEISWLNNENKTSAGIGFEDFIVAKSHTKTNRQIANAQTPITTMPEATARATTPKPFSAYSLVEVEQLLRGTLNNTKTADEIVSRARLDAGSAVIFRDHIQKLYGNELLVQRLAQQLYDARTSFSNDTAYDMGREIAQATSLKLMFAGLSRLSDTDIRAFIKHMAAIPTKADPKECKAIFSQNNSDPLAEFRAIASNGPQSLSNYLALMRKATNAELSDYPPKVAVSEAQKKLSDKAAENAFSREFLKLQKEDVERISAALSSPEGAPDADVCDGYYLVFKVTSELDGLPGEWYRRAFINGLDQR